MPIRDMDQDVFNSEGDSSP